MAFKVCGSVLPLAIDGLVEILHDLGACRLRSFEVRINIIDEYSQALSLMSDL
jgi:hypothetical protein